MYLLRKFRKTGAFRRPVPEARRDQCWDIPSLRGAAFGARTSVMRGVFAVNLGCWPLESFESPTTVIANQAKQSLLALLRLLRCFAPRHGNRKTQVGPPISSLVRSQGWHLEQCHYIGSRNQGIRNRRERQSARDHQDGRAAVEIDGPWLYRLSCGPVIGRGPAQRIYLIL